MFKIGLKGVFSLQSDVAVWNVSQVFNGLEYSLDALLIYSSGLADNIKFLASLEFSVELLNGIAAFRRVNFNLKQKRVVFTALKLLS